MAGNAQPSSIQPSNVQPSNVQPSVVSFAGGQSSNAAGQLLPGTSSTNAMPAIPAIPAEPLSQTGQAPLESQPSQWVTTNLQIAPRNTSEDNAAEPLEIAGGPKPVVATEEATGSPVSGMANARDLASAMVSAANPPLPMRTATPSVAAKAVAENTTATHNAAAASPLSASSTGSNSIGGRSTTSQTPFSVFFSDSGAGAASAVSALPKVILPANAAAHTSSSISSAEPGGNTTSNSHNNVAQNVAAQTGKETPSGSQSENAQAAPPPRKDADANAANATLALASSSVAPVAATPAPAAPVPVAVVPQSSVPAVASDVLPKADGTQAGAENSGTSVPVTPQAAAVALPGPVQMAQMVNRIGQAEMRIGMNTSAFGSVEVRTVVHASDVGVIIGSEKGDLRTLLANEMPVITSSLQQQSLRLNSVNFMQGFAFSNNQSGGGESQQRSFVPAPSPANSGSHEVAGDDPVETPTPLGFVGSSTSLSILA